MTDCFLTDHAKNIVSKYSEFENQFIGIELAGRKTFYSHIRFNFAVELFAFTMGMVESNIILITVTEVSPNHIDFNIRYQKKLTVSHGCAFCHFVDNTIVDNLFFTGLRCVMDVLEGAADVNRFPFSGAVDVFAP